MGRVTTTSPPIAIIGAGVLGLCAAFELSRRGHAVRVIDPGGANASSVAAGMIAPAMEAAIDQAAPEQAALFRAGRDLWPAFAQAAGISLNARPAEWRGPQAGELAERMAALGFAARRDGDTLVTDEDLQVEPEQALAALRSALGAAVVNGEVLRLETTPSAWRLRLDGMTLEAAAVVLATGAGPAVPGAPPEALRLAELIQPIKGQIGRLPSRPVAHVVRGPGAYVAPMGRGAVVGATMEPGRRDLDADPAAAQRLVEAAGRVLGRPLDPAEVAWGAGVRGASPDGLPLAGAVPDADGLFLALAPRRNGWLLGPLVAGVVADAIEGRASEHAAALDPGRF